MVIHDQGTLPFPEEDGMAVKAGTETFIGLRRVSGTELWAWAPLIGMVQYWWQYYASPGKAIKMVPKTTVMRVIAMFIVLCPSNKIELITSCKFTQSYARCVNL